MAAHSERLFFALWPSDKVRRILAEWQRSPLPASGRWVMPANLHITLLFLGSVNTDTRECLLAAADKLKSAAFSLRLTETGIWRKPQVAWLAAKTPLDPGLIRFVNDLRALSATCGLQVDARDYVPHVTLARKVKKLPRQWLEKTDPDIYWHASEFVLARSQTSTEGVMYEAVNRWAL